MFEQSSLQQNTNKKYLSHGIDSILWRLEFKKIELSPNSVLNTPKASTKAIFLSDNRRDPRVAEEAPH